jgi:hypothetical protein
MSNPTSNFLWQMPTSSDLVTDLPADFEVFGQAVDTALADLKGGTTGQVLAKNSGTDMDFIWTAADDTTLEIEAQTGTTYTFALADQPNILVTASNAAAQTYSIPTNASVAFPIGCQINIIQIGAGQVTINAVTSGTTTVLSTGASAAAPKLRAQYSAATCIKVATDTWYVVGDVA